MSDDGAGLNSEKIRATAIRRGVVTEAGDGFEGWLGRRIFEGGNVNFDFPYSGQGFFRIN